MNLMIKYEVYLKGEPNTAKIVEVTDEDLIERYGEITSPTTMYVKDLACSKGLFTWGDYTKLRARKIKEINNDSTER